MNLFRNIFVLNTTQRRIIAVLAFVLAMTSTRVQAADVHGVLPDAPLWDAGSVEQNDIITRGMIVPNALLGSLQGAADAPSVRVAYARVTGYASLPNQTDSSPYITADGTDLRRVPNVVATNCLKFGTKIRIPAKFGNRVFVVHDRMNARFSNCSATELDHVDIWLDIADLPTAEMYKKANEVGNSRLKIEIL